MRKNSSCYWKPGQGKTAQSSSSEVIKSSVTVLTQRRWMLLTHIAVRACAFQMCHTVAHCQNPGLFYLVFLPPLTFSHVMSKVTLLEEREKERTLRFPFLLKPWYHTCCISSPYRFPKSNHVVKTNGKGGWLMFSLAGQVHDLIKNLYLYQKERESYWGKANIVCCNTVWT